MRSIEFVSVLKDGVVVIPAPYRAQWEGKAIRVILCENNELELQPNPFTAVSLKTKGFSFNRQEANER